MSSLSLNVLKDLVKDANDSQLCLAGLDKFTKLLMGRIQSLLADFETPDYVKREAIQELMEATPEQLKKVLSATTEVILIGGGWLRRRLNYEEPEVKEAVKKIVTLVNTVEFQSTFDSLKVTQINAALEFLTEEQIAIVEDVLKENREKEKELGLRK